LFNLNLPPTLNPTPEPSLSPTLSPTPLPTGRPTRPPSPLPTPEPTQRPVLDLNNADAVADWLLGQGERFVYDASQYEL
jgi:hypothetical protein